MALRLFYVLAVAVTVTACSADNSGMWPPDAWPVELRSPDAQAEAALAQQTQQAQATRINTPAPAPRAPQSIRERMRELKMLYLEQLITPAEYEAKKAKVLDEL